MTLQELLLLHHLLQTVLLKFCGAGHAGYEPLWWVDQLLNLLAVVQLMFLQ